MAGARTTIYGVKDIHVQSVGLAGMAAAQAQIGDVVGALHTTEAIRDSGWEDDALHDIAGLQARAGDMPGALSTAERIPTADPVSLLDALVQISTAQAKAGDIPSALLTAKRIGNTRYLKPSAFGHIAAAQVVAHDVSGTEYTMSFLTRGEERTTGYIKLAEALLECP